MPIHDTVNYSTSICPLKSEKCRKEVKYFQNLNILRTKRALSMKYKTFFILFEGLTRGGSRTAATSKMEHFVNYYHSLSTLSSIFDVAAVLDPPLLSFGEKIKI